MIEETKAHPLSVATCLAPDAVVVRGLSFTYAGAKVPALSGVTMVVHKGERMGIVGPSGAGKSTLLLCIVGLLRGEGNIEVAGLELRKENLREVWRRCGFVFQNPDDQLFSTTVFDDVAFGPTNLSLPRCEVERRVSHALKQVEMVGFEQRLPQHLSVGEKKRVAIATALSMDPEILILDEPSSGLDSGLRRKLINLLKRLGLTILVASHDLELVRSLCDRVLVLRCGKRIAEGSTEILHDPAVMAEACLEPLSPVISR